MDDEFKKQGLHPVRVMQDWSAMSKISYSVIKKKKNKTTITKEFGPCKWSDTLMDISFD